MVRLFSLNHLSWRLKYICLFLTIQSLLFMYYIKLRRVSPEISDEFDISYASLPLNIRSEQSISQYFEKKDQTRKQSSFKVVLHDTYQKSSNNTSYLIYEYTRHRQFCKKQSNSLVYLSTCPFRNCQFTCNSSLAQEADAVLMLYSQLNYQKLLEQRTSRNGNQVWLLWNDEPYSPATAYNIFLFNWTISYRLDSEVSVAAYGVTSVRNAPMHELLFRNWTRENFRKRYNKAVWFVSNCNSKARLQYYDQLKEHFPISGFGNCIVKQANISQKCTRRSQCELEQLSTSKFYLAFESTTSRLDYITEKFWRSLAHGTIPIVLGPKRRDYERVAPPNSFIYAKDYSNPQMLVNHLNHVATNMDEFEKYHRWRTKYETFYQGPDVESVRFCELCYKLNTNHDRIWYTDINKFFLETDTEN